MTEEWFTKWFNSGLYQRVYSNRDLTEAGKLYSLLNGGANLRGKAVLDLGCGAGRHSLLYARNGCTVTGVDISEALLSEAESVFKLEALSGRFLKADLRTFIPDAGGYDIVLNLFTSFGYFSEDTQNFRIFRIADAALKPDGLFYFDYFNIPYLIKYLIPSDSRQADGLTITQQRRIENRRVIKDIVIETGEKKLEFTESVKLYTHTELIAAIEDAGLRIVKLFGDYSGSGFNPETSQRLIIVAQKP